MNLLVSAIPRPGTNYVTYFLFFLHSILVKMIDGRGVDAPVPVPPIAEYRHLGRQILAVAHTSLDEKYMAFPGGTGRETWRALNFYHRLYNDLKFHWDEDEVVRNFIGARGSVDLADAATRHVFLYRNILDQMTWFFFHLKNHFRADARGYTDAAGTFGEFADMGDFLRNGAVESYLKYYLSYQWAAPQFRAQILFLTYEEMMAEPKDAFSALLRFADPALDLGAMDEAMDMALQMAAPENLKNLEREQGKILANDQKINKGNTHMRDGGTGVWKKHLGDDDLDYVEEKLNRFGLFLSDFRIEP